MPDFASPTHKKRIVKNTLALYARMLLTTLVSLYTSRVVLDVLGVEDYGTYNVVGGIVVLFLFLNSSLSASTQRFFSFDMGIGDIESLKKTFNMAFYIHTTIALIVFFIAETIGLWFIIHKMVLPDGRTEAAIWVYQFSIISSILTIISVPFSACITSHEKFGIYAYLSIFDAIGKLIIVFLLPIIEGDKLKLYAALILFITICSQGLTIIYCYRNFSECRVNRKWDKIRFQEMIDFAGWNMGAHFSLFARTYGLNIIINLFWGTALNAARGIAVSVNGVIGSFAQNINLTVNPQIVKQYANAQHESMHTLAIQACKFAYLLLLCISLPLIIEMNFILGIWLKEVPNYAVLFCRCILIATLMDTLSSVVGQCAVASGRIKTYQIFNTSFSIIVPISTYIAYRSGAPVSFCAFAEISLFGVLLFTRPILTHRITKFPILSYMKLCVVPCLVITFLSLVIPYYFLLSQQEGFERFILVGASSLSSTALFSYYIGLKPEERQTLKHSILSKIKK